ncbi:MAG: glycosyltransferase family 4 protein [Prevotellaceae bacterium]|jgi:glycosyltransferase involved in cell wall biosynthesis|nr:glycosyltransferase family 4 protein [Prevotellaceae bacterium]
MNIIFDCERMKHPYTGLFEYCTQLGRALKAAAGTGNEMSFYIPPEYKNYFGSDSQYHIHLPVHKFIPLRVKQVDIWHSSNARPAFVKSVRKMKRIITVHDLNFLYEKSSQIKINRYLKALQNSADRADAIITISKYAKTDIVNHLKLNGKPVSVIYNGCNVLEFPAYDTPVYRPAAPFLFSIGTVVPKKNFHVLPCLLKNNGYELIIAGQGKDGYVQKIVEEAKKHNVEDRVKLTGPVKNEDKYWYLKNCSAFLFPSVAEGFGIPPIEAMHFGKPVFLSTKTSLPEIGGQYAYYFNDFEPENICKAFETGMNHYAQTGQESLIIKHAGQFNWEKSAGEYWEVYKSVLQI